MKCIQHQELVKKIINLANEAEENIKDIFENIEKIEEYNSIKKVLNAFQKKTKYQKYILIVPLVMDMEIQEETQQKKFLQIYLKQKIVL